MEDMLSKWYENLTYSDAKTILEEKLTNIKMSFIAAGYYLKYIRDNELYLEDGYNSILEFAEDNYGIKRSTSSRWMAMNDKFSQNGNSPILADEYKEFGKSQLQEMLYLEDEKIKEITPDMTVKEIRKVREPEKKEEPAEEQVEGQMSVEDYPEMLPEEPELDKPNEVQRAYLNDAAKHLIRTNKRWFLEDFHNRVSNVLQSEKEIKSKFVLYTRYFSTDKGVGHINLFEKYVQLWDEKSNCIGDFEWFYLCVAIQSMWNEVALEDANAGKEDMCDVAQGVEAEKYEVVADAKYIEVPTECAAENDQILEERCENSSIDCDRDIDLLRAMLKEENADLEEWISVDKVDPLPANMIRKKKLTVSALASMLCDLENVDDNPEEEQPELPALKNNDQRKEFIDDYANWPIWFESEETKERYYRFNFENGNAFVVKVYFHRCFDYSLTGVSYEERFADKYGSEEYYLLKPGKYFKDCLTNKSRLVDYLKELQKRK